MPVNKYRSNDRIRKSLCATTNLKYDSHNQMFAGSIGWTAIG